MLLRLRLAIGHARRAIWLMAMIYAVSIAAGIAMAHSNNRMALRFRDTLVRRANRTDPAARADAAGAHARAAALDFSRDLVLVAFPDTVGGLTLILPVALGAYRGWVGGIVSVDGAHSSRFHNVESASYYVIVVLVQVCGFVLAAAGGIHLGWATLRRNGALIGPGWFRISRSALVDALWLYTLIVPLFAVGSSVEFFWR